MNENRPAPHAPKWAALGLLSVLMIGVTHPACTTTKNDPGYDTGLGPDAYVDLDSSTPDPDGGVAVDAAPDGGGSPDIGPAGQFTETLAVDGVTRTYQLYVPDSAVTDMADGPVPLLIALHGAGDSGSNFIAATGLTSSAAANGFVLVGPEGFNAGWFVQTDEGWPQADGYQTSLQNDAELLLTIIDETSADYWIDPDAVFAVGHSRGAGCVGLLATLSGDMTIASGTWQTPFAAYGINAGYDAAGGQQDMSLATPKVPILIIHGTSDGVVPFSYGEDLANDLITAGWDVTFTPVSGGAHTWLFQNQQLWNDLLSAAGY